jgi:hypothetical protein
MADVAADDEPFEPMRLPCTDPLKRRWELTAAKVPSRIVSVRALVFRAKTCPKNIVENPLGARLSPLRSHLPSICRTSFELIPSLHQVHY